MTYQDLYADWIIAEPRIRREMIAMAAAQGIEDRAMIQFVDLMMYVVLKEFILKHDRLNDERPQGDDPRGRTSG